MRFAIAAAALMFVSTPLFAQVKRPVPTPEKVPFENSLQAVIVTTPDWRSVQGTARLYERKNGRSDWKSVGDGFPIVVGRSGLGMDSEMKWTGYSDDLTQPIKKEGDGRAPGGLFPLVSTFGIKDVGSRLPFTELNQYTECVDDTSSNFYNRIVNRMQVGNFDWKSSEKMLAVGAQYDLGVFVAYNSYPAIRGNGSCIFLHIWKTPDTGTSGCTAMARENLEKIVRWLEPEKHPYLVQMTSTEYKSRRKSLRLPTL
jgi:L,D-peptidoglycan transpeptidase YkuD (ErfK/YbiS/YcfS/YnhG family)